MDNTKQETALDDSDKNPLTNIPIEITVSVGHARPLVKELLLLEKNSILTLDKRIDDPVELYIGDRLIGFGTLELDQEGGENSHLVVRLNEVISLKNSV